MAQSRNVSREADQQMTIIPAERLPVPIGLDERFGIDRAGWRALCESVFPMAKTPGAIVLALAYCRARKLDVFKRVVHIVPMWNSTLDREVETVWPGIAEHRITAARTENFAGCDAAVFGPTVVKSFAGKKKTRTNKVVEAEVKDLAFPEWCQITVYRIVQGQRVPFPGPRVYFAEYFGYRKGLPVPNERWTRAPFQMLEKCAEAAALRRAFPEELNEPVAEEMDGRVIVAGGAPVADGAAAPQADDFKNDKGVPQDGVTQVVDGDEDAEFEDDPAIRVVDEGTPAQAQTAKPAGDDTKTEDGKGAPQAQASPPAASRSEEGDGRPEPPLPEGVEAQAPAEPETSPVGIGPDVDAWIADDLPKLGDLGALRDFQRKGRFKIDESPATNAEKSRLRGKFNAACLEREKVLQNSRTARKP